MIGNTNAQSVKLGWQSSDNPNIESYGIYRTIHIDSSFSLIATINHPDTSYTDNGVENDVHYYYAATSIDNVGNESGFSNVVDTTITAALPVELFAFSANVQGNEILLEWETATEINNLGFELQRSKDNPENFSKLAFLKGNGTSVSPNKYVYRDQNLTDGTYFYRLKQVDFDGRIEYSGVVNVNIGHQPDEFMLAQNYPNPFNPETCISYSLAQSGPVKLLIFDINGKIVKTLVNKFQNTGNYQAIWNGCNDRAIPVASGMYYYKIVTNNGVKFRKMTLIK